jgi:hypothetical protein
MRLIVSLEDFGFVNRLSDGRYTLASEVRKTKQFHQFHQQVAVNTAPHVFLDLKHLDKLYLNA